MICYRDRSFCGSKNCENKCGQKLTDEMYEDAKKWWHDFTNGRENEPPIAYMLFCK